MLCLYTKFNCSEGSRRYWHFAEKSKSNRPEYKPKLSWPKEITRDAGLHPIAIA